MEKETEKGEGGKEKGKICGFDAGISPWGMAGWLVGWLVLRSGALSECLLQSPRHHFQQSPCQESRTNWEEGGREAEEKKEEAKKSCSKKRRGWKRRESGERGQGGRREGDHRGGEQ